MARLKGLELRSEGIRELLNSAAVRANLTDRMTQALAMAQSQVPVDTGALRDSLHIEQQKTDRVGVRLVADTDYAWFVEANTGFLNRALRAARK